MLTPLDEYENLDNSDIFFQLCFKRDLFKYTQNIKNIYIYRMLPDLNEADLTEAYDC